MAGMVVLGAVGLTMGIFGAIDGGIENENRLIQDNQRTAALEVQEAAVNAFDNQLTRDQAALDDQSAFYSSDVGKKAFNMPALPQFPLNEGNVSGNNIYTVNENRITFENYPNIFLDAREFCDDNMFHVGTSFLRENLSGPVFINPKTADPLFNNCSNIGNDTSLDPISGNAYVEMTQSPGANPNQDTTTSGIEDLNSIQRMALEQSNTGQSFCQTYDKFYNMQIVNDNLNRMQDNNELTYPCSIHQETDRFGNIYTPPTDAFSSHLKYYMCTPRCTPRALAGDCDVASDNPEVNDSNPFCKIAAPGCADKVHAPFKYVGIPSMKSIKTGDPAPSWAAGTFSTFPGTILDSEGDTVNVINYVKLLQKDELPSSITLPCKGLEMFGELNYDSISENGGTISFTYGNEDKVVGFSGNDPTNNSLTNLVTCTGTATVDGNWLGGTQTEPAITQNCTPPQDADNHNVIYMWPNMNKNNTSDGGASLGCTGLPRFKLYLDPYYVPPGAEGLTYNSPEVVEWRRHVEQSDAMIPLFNIYSSGLGNLDPTLFGLQEGGGTEFQPALGPGALAITRQVNYFQAITSLFFGNRLLVPYEEMIDIVTDDNIQLPQLQENSQNTVNVLRQPLLWIWTQDTNNWTCNQWGGKEFLWNVIELNNLVFSKDVSTATNPAASNSFVQAGESGTSASNLRSQTQQITDTEAIQSFVTDAIYVPGSYFMGNAGVFADQQQAAGDITYAAQTLFTVPCQQINTPLAIGFYAFYQVYLELVLARRHPTLSPLWTAFFAGSDVKVGDNDIFHEKGTSRIGDQYIGDTGSSGFDIDYNSSQLTRGIKSLEQLISVLDKIGNMSQSYGSDIDRFLRGNSFQTALICNSSTPCLAGDKDRLLKSVNNVPLTSARQEINCLSEMGRYLCPRDIWQKLEVIDFEDDIDDDIAEEVGKTGVSQEKSKTYINNYIKTAVQNAIASTLKKDDGLNPNSGAKTFYVNIGPAILYVKEDQDYTIDFILKVLSKTNYPRLHQQYGGSEYRGPAYAFGTADDQQTPPPGARMGQPDLGEDDNSTYFRTGGGDPERPGVDSTLWWGPNCINKGEQFTDANGGFQSVGPNSFNNNPCADWDNANFAEGDTSPGYIVKYANPPGGDFKALSTPDKLDNFNSAIETNMNSMERLMIINGEYPYQLNHPFPYGGQDNGVEDENTMTIGFVPPDYIKDIYGEGNNYNYLNYVPTGDIFKNNQIITVFPNNDSLTNMISDNALTASVTANIDYPPYKPEIWFPDDPGFQTAEYADDQGLNMVDTEMDDFFYQNYIIKGTRGNLYTPYRNNYSPDSVPDSADYIYNIPAWRVFGTDGGGMFDDSDWGGVSSAFTLFGGVGLTSRPTYNNLLHIKGFIDIPAADRKSLKIVATLIEYVINLLGSDAINLSTKSNFNITNITAPLIDNAVKDLPPLNDWYSQLEFDTNDPDQYEQNVYEADRLTAQDLATQRRDALNEILSQLSTPETPITMSDIAPEKTDRVIKKYLFHSFYTLMGSDDQSSSDNQNSDVIAQGDNLLFDVDTECANTLYKIYCENNPEHYALEVGDPEECKTLLSLFNDEDIDLVASGLPDFASAKLIGQSTPFIGGQDDGDVEDMLLEEDTDTP